MTGLAFETEVETFREGGVNDAEHQLTGAAKFPSKIVLKRGLADDYLWDWYQQVASGDVQRKDVTVKLLDYKGQKKCEWSFKDACPIKWTGPELKAQTSSVAFEAVELVHRGLLPATTGAVKAPERTKAG